MSLVGDAIIEAREAFPDPCQSIGAPNAADFTVSQAVTAGATLPLGTYYLIFTLMNQWGESAPSAEVPFTTTGGNNSILISAPATLPYLGSYTTYRVYFATATGAQQAYFQAWGITQVTITSIGGSTSSGILSGLVSSIIPTRSSMWLPDTDGGFVSASTMYRWMNDGLQSMSRIAGGIPGMTGVPATAGQSMYRIPGRWIHLTNGWFDGWPLTFGKRGDVFLHNLVPGVTGIVTTEEWTDQTIVQAWPQPNRTGAAAQLTSPAVVSGDGSIVIDNSSGFLPIGLAYFFGGPNLNQGGPAPIPSNSLQTELFAYTGIDATHLLNAIRAIGGTQQQSWPTSTAVRECNLRFAGFRQPTTYYVGQSSFNLPIPLGWEVSLSNYIVSQYRRAEQQEQEAQAMEKEFTADITALAKLYRGRKGPTQIGSTTREVYPGGFGGGLLVQ